MTMMPRGFLVEILSRKGVARQQFMECAGTQRRPLDAIYTSVCNPRRTLLRRLSVGATRIPSSVAVSLASENYAMTRSRVPWSSRRRNVSVYRAMAAGRRGGGGGGDVSVFEKWLAANPLPGTPPSIENAAIRATDPQDSISVTDALSHSKLKRLLDDEEYHTNFASDSEHMYEKKTELGCAEFDTTEFWPASFCRRPSPNRNRSTMPSPALEHNGIWWQGYTGSETEDLQGRRHRKYSWRDTADVFYECMRECGQMVWDNKHKIFLQVSSSDGTKPLAFVPPLIQLPIHASCTPSEYLKTLRESNDGGGQSRVLLALVSSSAAALGVFQDDALVLHKVVTAYTVRAKQGKAQLHYLRQGGPGRMSVGGGLRARETERLFSRICEKLDEWQKEIEGCKFLFYSGNMRVWNEVYACNDPRVPVSRDDIRWRKVPYSVRQPRLRELQRVYYGLSHGVVGYGAP